MTTPGADAPAGEPPRRGPLGYVGAIALALIVGAGTFLALSARQSTGDHLLPLPPGFTVPGSATDGPTATAAPGPVTSAPAPRAPAGDPATATRPPARTQPPPPPPVLRAAYSSSPRLLGLSGYTGRVRITNPGSTGADGWTVVITLPSSASYEGASGATVEQTGNRLAFRPTNATRGVAAGAAVEFTFEVGGVLAGQPAGCAIDGRPCS